MIIQSPHQSSPVFSDIHIYICAIRTVKKVKLSPAKSINSSVFKVSSSLFNCSPYLHLDRTDRYIPVKSRHLRRLLHQAPKSGNSNKSQRKSYSDMSITFLQLGYTMDYVSMTLQASPNMSCEALLYSQQKRTLKRKVKLEDFIQTDDQKIAVDDTTFVGVPHQFEYSFQHAEVPSQFSREPVKVLEVLTTNKKWDSVMVPGKIT